MTLTPMLGRPLEWRERGGTQCTLSVVQSLEAAAAPVFELRPSPLPNRIVTRFESTHLSVCSEEDSSLATPCLVCRRGADRRGGTEPRLEAAAAGIDGSRLLSPVAEANQLASVSEHGYLVLYSEKPHSSGIRVFIDPVQRDAWPSLWAANVHAFVIGLQVKSSALCTSTKDSFFTVTC